MSSNNFRDVHTFDGTLGQHFTSTESFTPEQKVQLFSDFRDKLHSDTAKLMIQSIIVDLDNQNNIDSTNGVDSSDILAEICKKVVTVDIDLVFIEEQIVDIALLGPCPEGKTTRFLQIWQAIKDC